MVVNIASPFLFFVPHAQLERAEMMAIDRYIMSHQWESFLDEIQDEWNRTALSVRFTLSFVIMGMSCNCFILGHNCIGCKLRISGNPHVSRYNSGRTQFSGTSV
jgi:hypothetical protein